MSNSIIAVLEKTILRLPFMKKYSETLPFRDMYNVWKRERERERERERKLKNKCSPRRCLYFFYVKGCLFLL